MPLGLTDDPLGFKQGRTRLGSPGIFNMVVRKRGEASYVSSTVRLGCCDTLEQINMY